VIVRIMGEGQFVVPDTELDTLNALDDRLETAVEDSDSSAFSAAFGALLDKVRELGEAAPDDLLEESDVILPPADSALSDVAQLLAEGAGDGLIPG
jgi:hypothetical protein